MEDLYGVIERLMKFTSKVLTHYAGATNEQIDNFEKKYYLTLPNDFKAFLKTTNGISLMGTTVLGIQNEPVFLSMANTYNIEHFDVYNKMPNNLIPFSPDGGGNHYCFDSNKRNEESFEVIFWQHDLTYSQEYPPEVVNNSFTEWAKEVLLEWTIEDYDYNGNKKEKY